MDDGWWIKGFQGTHIESMRIQDRGPARRRAKAIVPWNERNNKKSTDLEEITLLGPDPTAHWRRIGRINDKLLIAPGPNLHRTGAVSGHIT